jgi:hypothetical protein
MAFDISKLTSAVNKYLNSISDVSEVARKASEEIEQKSRFKTELSDAIRQNIESRMRDGEVVPDISESVKDQVRTAVSSIDATIEQINGAFESIQGAGKVSEVSASGSEDADGTDLANAADLILSAAGSSADATGLRKALNEVLNVSGASKAGNYDAYKGLLSTEALQELSRSQYFSANLIQSSLFEEQNGDNSGSSGSTSFTTSLANALQSGATTQSPFEDISLSDLNTASLTASGDASGNASTDLAKALIKAYANSASNSAVTSIFGDFTL